jgi:hypothetical protein
MDEMDRLIHLWTKANQAWREADMARRDIVNDMTAEFVRRREEAIAEGIAPQTFAEGPGVEVTFKSPPITWEKALDGPLRVLAEVMDPVAFEKLLTKQAEPKPPPPRQFDMREVKPLEGRGGEYARAIARARTIHPAEAKPRVVNNRVVNSLE